MAAVINGISQEDIMFILNNPWKTTAAEWSLDDQEAIDKAYENVKAYLKSSVEDGYARLWKTVLGEPIAMLCGFKVAEKTYETIFLASRHMEDSALKISFDMRKILKQKSLEYRGCKLRIYSTSDHSHQITWFRFLGFKYSPESDDGNTRVFEYESPDG